MRNLWILFLLVCFSAMAETDVTINLQDSRISAAPYAFRNVTVQPMGVPTANQSSIILGNKLLLISDQNGNIVISNQFGPMLYQVTVQSPPAQESFKYIVQSTNLGTIYAANNLVASDSATYPAGSVAWAISASDARYLQTNNQGVTYLVVTNALGYAPMFTNANLAAWSLFSTNALGAGGNGGNASFATNSGFATNASFATNANFATNALWAANATNAVNATNYVGPLAYATNGSGISGNGNALTNIVKATNAIHLLAGDFTTNLQVQSLSATLLLSTNSTNYDFNGRISGDFNGRILYSVSGAQTFAWGALPPTAPSGINVSGGNIILSGGGSFTGNGGNLSNLNSLQLTNVIPNSWWPLAAGANVTLSTNAGGTVTISSLGGSATNAILIQSGVGNLTTLTNPTFTGTANAGIMSATTFIGDGFQITDLNANNLSGTIYATNLPIGTGFTASTQATPTGAYMSVTTNTHNYVLTVIPEWHNYLTNTGANSTNETTWGTFHAQNAVSIGGALTVGATITGPGSGITALNGSAISSGTVPPANLGSGTPSAATVLLGNGTWGYLTNLSVASNNLFIAGFDGLGTNTAFYSIGSSANFYMNGQSGAGSNNWSFFAGNSTKFSTPHSTWPVLNGYIAESGGANTVGWADIGTGRSAFVANNLYAEDIILGDTPALTSWASLTNQLAYTNFPYTYVTNSPWPTNLESLQWTFQSLQATGAFYGSFVGTLTNPGIVGPLTFSAPIILTNNNFTNWDGRYFQSNVITGTSFETTTNGQLRIQDQYGNVTLTGTNGVLNIGQTNGASFIETNGSLTLTGNITVGGSLTATTNGLYVGGSITSGLGMPTNAAAYFHPSSNTTNQFVINTVYTNIAQRSLLVGSAVLSTTAGTTANITFYYTNAGLNCFLPIQAGGSPVTNFTIPFSIPLGSNATFSAVSTLGAGCVGYITNTMNWGQ